MKYVLLAEILVVIGLTCAVAFLGGYAYAVTQATENDTRTPMLMECSRQLGDLAGRHRLCTSAYSNLVERIEKEKGDL